MMFVIAIVYGVLVIVMSLRILYMNSGSWKSLGVSVGSVVAGIVAITYLGVPIKVAVFITLVIIMVISEVMSGGESPLETLG